MFSLQTGLHWFPVRIIFLKTDPFGASRPSETTMLPPLAAVSRGAEGKKHLGGFNYFSFLPLLGEDFQFD